MNGSVSELVPVSSPLLVVRIKMNSNACDVCVPQVEGDLKRVLAERRSLMRQIQTVSVVDDAVRELYLQMKVRAVLVNRERSTLSGVKPQRADGPCGH